MPVLSKEKISTTFAAQKERIFMRKDVARLISSYLDEWRVRKSKADSGSQIMIDSLTQHEIFEALTSETELKEIELPFPYRSIKRYTWGDVTTYQIVQSVDKDGYFSHYSAMQILGLTEQIPKTVYFNVEQPASGGGGSLSQEGIDRAFRGKCRVSNNTINFKNFRICKLNGQNTNRLGVIEVEDKTASISATNLERTLIDATVRPVYSGGIGEVANAYKAAAKQLSIKKITTYLRQLNYTYPYHQAVGYYLERTGYFNQDQLDELRKFPIDFDFYITYQLKNPGYDKNWRLFIPKGF